MVANAYKYSEMEVVTTISKNPLFLPAPLRYGSISINKMVENGHRLDASAYNIEAVRAVSSVEHCRYGALKLWSEGGLVKSAYYPGRYKRIYSDRNNGIPFFLPSQLEEIFPKASKFISRSTAETLKNDIIKKDLLLLSRSGTIGKCTISSKSTIGKIFSDDVIRIDFNGKYDLGYVYAFLNTEVGLTILQSNNYGAVIDHIEPEHLRKIPIPNAPDEIKKEIHDLIVSSYDLRDQSNELIDNAQKILYKELQLPDISEIKPRYRDKNAGFRNYSIKVSELNNRFDASYHIPDAKSIIDIISRNAAEITTIGDKRLSKRIILAGVFKRTYVEKNKGVPFLGGRDIMLLSPNVEKFLSVAVHSERIKKELEVSENYVLVSDRGTIGKVQIVPKHWNGWAVSQNVIKIVPTKGFEGYIYAYLSSDYAQILIKREIYGSVVDMIDDNNVGNIVIPLLKDKEKQTKINDLVLQANKLRYEAYLKEQEAIDLMNKILE